MASTEGIPRTLEQVCDVDSSLLLGWQYSRFVQAAAKLASRNVSATTLLRFRDYWDKETFLGKKGQAPKPEQVLEEWVRFTKWLEASFQSGIAKQTASKPPCKECEGSGYVPDFKGNRMLSCPRCKPAGGPTA